jgi:hypothetical protein
MRTFLLFLLIAAAPARADDITVSGHIDATMAVKLHAALADGKTHTLHVNSAGGDDLAALALAEDIRHAHASLVVEGLCAGPCAGDLFVAAAARNVAPGGLVIFAASPTSRLAVVPASRVKETLPGYAEAAQKEKQLFAEMHADPALLLEPQIRLQTQCYSLTSRNPAGQAYINYQAQAVGWIPSRVYLAHAGIKVNGFWPASDAQFQTALKNAFPGGATGTVVFGGTDKPLPQSVLTAQLAATKECPKR